MGAAPIDWQDRAERQARARKRLQSYLLRRGRGRIIAGTMASHAASCVEFRRTAPPGIPIDRCCHLMLSPAPRPATERDGQWQQIAERYAEAMGM
jgi:hypothetical protein